MKDIFLELLKPCCRFSFENFRKFINAVEFRDESVRQEILNGIKIDGNLTPSAWVLFIENAIFDLYLTDEMLQTWLDDCFDLSCERWEYLVKHVVYSSNFEVSYNEGFEGQFLIGRRGGRPQYININNADDLKLWLEEGIDYFGGENNLTNVKIIDFKKEYINVSYTIKCNLYADGEEIQFSQIFNRVHKFGEIKGLKTLKMYYNEVREFIVKNEAETLETIYIEGLYDLQSFDTLVNLKSLKDLRLIFVNELQEFDPTKPLPNLETLKIFASSLTRFTPTKPLPKLSTIQVQKNNIQDWSFTNWISHLPKNGTCCFDGDALFDGSPTDIKLRNKEWFVNLNCFGMQKGLYLLNYNAARMQSVKKLVTFQIN